MKIIVFSKYDYSGPSSRYRFYNYEDMFFNEKIEFKIIPLFSKKYTSLLFKGSKLRKLLMLSVFYLRRIVLFFYYLPCSNFVIQAEILPYFPAFFERILFYFNKRVIIDFDDAIFHYYNSEESSLIVKLFLGKKFDFILKNASAITTGSPYLTKYVLEFNPNVKEIPTSIIFNKYIYTNNRNLNNSLIIGWLGSPSSSMDLISILPVLKKLNYSFNFKIYIMGFDDSLKNYLKGLPVVFFNWDESEEINFLSSIDVGIMPLIRNNYNNGKCGFKLIQYMAMGKLTISTPLEANIKINVNGINLFADNNEEWFEAFKSANEIVKNFDYSISNRNVISKFYSVESNYTNLINFYKSFFN